MQQFLEAAGVGPRVRAASDLGRGFARFALDAARFPGPSLLVGGMPLLDEAARAVAARAVDLGLSARVVTPDELVDAAFERGAKAELADELAAAGFVAVVCGGEPRHSWAGPSVARVVLGRAHRSFLLQQVESAPA